MSSIFPSNCYCSSSKIILRGIWKKPRNFIRHILPSEILFSLNALQFQINSAELNTEREVFHNSGWYLFLKLKQNLMKMFTSKKNNCTYLYSFPYIWSQTRCFFLLWPLKKSPSAWTLAETLLKDKKANCTFPKPDSCFIPSSIHKILHATGLPKDL